eukprot:2667492-Pyramimonas_sp.AAC.2
MSPMRARRNCAKELWTCAIYEPGCPVPAGGHRQTTKHLETAGPTNTTRAVQVAICGSVHMAPCKHELIQFKLAEPGAC